MKLFEIEIRDNKTGKTQKQGCKVANFESEDPEQAKLAIQQMFNNSKANVTVTDVKYVGVQNVNNPDGTTNIDRVVEKSLHPSVPAMIDGHVAEGIPATEPTPTATPTPAPVPTAVATPAKPEVSASDAAPVVDPKPE